MERKNIINRTFIVFEILFSTGLFYLFRYMLNVTDFPFTYDMFLGVLIGILTLLVLLVLTLFLFVKLNKKLTEENFNYPNSIIFLIIGIFLSLMTISIMNKMELNNGKLSEFFLILISYAIPLIAFNIGLRIKKKKTMHNNV